MNSGCGHEREPTVTTPAITNFSIELRGLFKSRRMRSNAKPTIRQTTPRQNTASATLSAGPRAKPNRSMCLAPLRFVVGALFAVMLTYAAHAGGRQTQSGAYSRSAAREVQDLARCTLTRLAPRGGRQRRIETLLVPKAGLGAADTAVSGLDRETGAAVPFDGCAGVVGRGSFAAQ